MRNLCRLAIAAAVLLLPLPAHAQTIAANEPVCFLRGNNRTIDLTSMCGESAGDAPIAIAQAIAPSSADAVFWQAFNQLGQTRPEAIALARQVGPEAVTTLAQQLCAVLDSSPSMDVVRQIEIDRGLPIPFAVALNVSAVNAYCPEYVPLLQQ